MTGRHAGPVGRGLALVLLGSVAAGCGTERSLESGLDPAVAERVAAIREGGEPLTGGTESEGVQTQWKAWLAGGEPMLIEEGVQIERRGTTWSLYLFEEGRLAFFRQTGQRPTSVLGGTGLDEVEVELRWNADGSVEGTKRVDREAVELPAWEEAVARERARDLRALVLAAAGGQDPGDGSAAGSSAETSP